jgi:uncharacterized protein YyaL (SSP411 family)
MYALFESALGTDNIVKSKNQSNELYEEKSPYLIQHATNPVHWMPWGERAFQRAKTENKPIFLSIGYSTCHWCHVMAHESFENSEIAEILNRDFVCIKVDREERPDVDRLYMSFVQATTGGGGWPMSVWLTPELKPFFGGTYFPPVDKFGRPGFGTLLERIAAAWRSDQPRILQGADETLAALQARTSTSVPQTPETLSSPADAKRIFDTAIQTLIRQYDEENGGFGSAPKFPRPATLNFLLRFASEKPSGERDAQIAAGMALQTLRKMAAGGIHDQLGGGFHRYSVDRFWHVPHYEKMLYDQAQLVCTNLDAYQLSGSPEFAAIARKTLDYIQSEMTDVTGGFHSAEDADSLFESGKPEHGEGAYYVWTREEIQRLLGKDSELFNAVFGVETDGNSPKGSDPHGELKGKNTLLRRISNADAATRFAIGEAEVDSVMNRCEKILLEARLSRPKPHRDDKILTSWNGLMISAFARGANVLAQPRYMAAARKAALLIKERMYSKGVLYRSYRGGRGSVEGFAEDYAFLIQGLLDLYQADFEIAWLQWALDLQAAQDRLFWDSADGGYFSSSTGDASVLIRLKEDHDSAEPAASSISARNLRRIFNLAGAEDAQARAESTIRAFEPVLAQSPTLMPQMLCNIMPSAGNPRQIVIAGELSNPDTQALLAAARAPYLGDALILHACHEAKAAGLGGKFASIADMEPIGGKAAAYVCENFTCKAPVTDAKELDALLRAGGK